MTNIAKVGSLIEYTSLSKELSYIPVRYNALGDLGVFTPEFLNTDTLIIPRITYKDYKYSDVPWGTRAKNNANNVKDYLPLVVPHYSYEEAILPMDVRGKFAWADVIANSRPETVQSFMAIKQATIKQSWANTWSAAMLSTVVNGTAYAPNSTVVTNYFTEFGVSQTVKNLVLTDETADPMPQIQAIIDDIQVNFVGGYVPQSFVGLLDAPLFDALARHPYVVNAYSVIQQSQSVAILTQQLGTQGLNLDARYQVLNFGGVVWVRMQTGLMTANEGRVFPVDVPDMFKIFYAPSDENFDTVNATAEQLFYYEYLGERRDKVEIHHQSNFLTAILWPKALIRVTFS